MEYTNKIAIIGVPQDLGASRRGVDMGPSAIRVAGLKKKLETLGYQVNDFGNIECQDIEISEKEESIKNPKLKHKKNIINTCTNLKKTVEQVVSDGFFPLILGGDHSLTIGTMAGLKKRTNGKIGIIWIDAHGDFNTVSTTPSGNIHGMPFGVITGRGDKDLLEIGPSPTVSEKNSVLIAVRDLDGGEIDNLIKSQITTFTMHDIDELGIAEVSRRAIDIACKEVDYLHVSFDIDALDPSVAPGTGTPVVGGLTYREAHLLLENIHKSGILFSFEMVEVNPTLDVRNQTAKLAVDLISSAFGKKII